MQTIIVFSTLESSWRMFSPQSRVSIKSGGLSEPPLFPPTIDLGLSPSWFFSGVLKKRHVGLCSTEKRYLFRRTVEEAPRAGCWSHRVKNRSCQQLWQWSVLLHCALCTTSKVAQAWSPQCKCAHNGPLWWLPPLLGLQSSCRAAFVSGGAAPPRPRPGDQWAPWQEGQSLFDAIMLALASTLLLSFTTVLALDVPAEVNKADMVDFGGRVLRKSGWLSIIWSGSGYTWKAGAKQLTTA